MIHRSAHSDRTFNNRKTQNKKGKGAILIASSAAMLIGVVIVIYGYLSYHSPIIWAGIFAVIIGLWWAALVASGRSPIAIRI